MGDFLAAFIVLGTIVVAAIMTRPPTRPRFGA